MSENKELLKALAEIKELLELLVQVSFLAMPEQRRKFIERKYGIKVGDGN
jgi:hypothetical protein